MQPLRDQAAHELVPRGMELDRIEARAAAIVGMQLRRIAVGHIAECEHRHIAESLAECAERRPLVRRAFTRERVRERRMAVEQIVINQLVGLI
jgi:hypothetical protein